MRFGAVPRLPAVPGVADHDLLDSGDSCTTDAVLAVVDSWVGAVPADGVEEEVADESLVRGAGFVAGDAEAGQPVRGASVGGE